MLLFYISNFSLFPCLLSCTILPLFHPYPILSCLNLFLFLIPSFRYPIPLLFYPPSLAPSLPYSTLPLFHPSLIPSFAYSILPLFHPSLILSFPYSILPLFHPSPVSFCSPIPNFSDASILSFPIPLFYPSLVPSCLCFHSVSVPSSP